MNTSSSDIGDSIIRCAVPAPLWEPLDYLAPADHTAPIEPGVRVRLPLGKRSLTAVVTGSSDAPVVPGHKLRAIEAVLDKTPLVQADQLALLDWCISYYCHPPGETYPLALSPRERRGEPPAATGTPGYRLTARGLGLPPEPLKRAKKQAELIEKLRAGPQSAAAIAAAGLSRPVIRALLAKDLIEPCQLSFEQRWRSGAPLAANKAQLKVIEAVTASFDRFQSHLLEGVTGSGKTEVYLQCIAPLIERGQQALLLVPEIGLTPQMVKRFADRFDAPIALLHSGLSDGERDLNWSLARSGQAAIILGTRSAVFAPIPRLGLIIVDEEHDSSYSQQDSVRYSARDVAIKRAQLKDCPVLLGSATPSLESMANAMRGRYQHHLLQQRAGRAQPPALDIVDIRGLELSAGLSSALRTSIDTTIEQGGQVLLFLNRRGFAPTLLCHDCGWVAECDHCDARLTLHQRPATLRCHHCSAQKALPASCPCCGSRRLVSTGLGTEQTESVLADLYPDTPVFRIDRDSMSGKAAMAGFVARIEAEGPCIMIGTQMLSKGHHFPRVTLVGVLDADALLFNPDFRAEERLLQLLIQVAGRAGREQRPGRVLVQTRHPDNPLISQALTQAYGTSAAALLESRRARGLPPEGAMALLRCDSRDRNAGMTFLQGLANQLPRAMTSRVIGPLPTAMARRAGLFRAQIIIQAPSRAEVREVMSVLVESARKSAPNSAKLRWFVDIDPIEVL